MVFENMRKTKNATKVSSLLGMDQNSAQFITQLIWSNCPAERTCVYQLRLEYFLIQNLYVVVRVENVGEKGWELWCPAFTGEKCEESMKYSRHSPLIIVISSHTQTHTLSHTHTRPHLYMRFFLTQTNKQMGSHLLAIQYSTQCQKVSESDLCFRQI